MTTPLDPHVEPDEAGCAQILQTSRTIAVLGAHSDPTRPAHEVPIFLLDKGYRVLPVNAMKAGEAILGDRAPAAFASLPEIQEPVDVVDVFRNSQAVAGHVDEILKMQPLPKVVWLQLGVRNDEAAAKLRAQGIVVVQDRCTKIEHNRMNGIEDEGEH